MLAYADLNWGFYLLGPTDETVGSGFNVDLLTAARDRTLDVILKAAKMVHPGMLESDARKLVQSVQAELGAPKSWHPAQIRFGENTLLPFGKKGREDIALVENDIFFFDIGPLFDDHEGDVGRPFTVGADQEMQRCVRDCEAIWHEVRNEWLESHLTGGALYDFAQQRATNRGWILSLEKANGHRIADFPHAAKKRGSIEGFEQKPAANRWILEIQIRHPEKPFGAFYEDLLA